MHEELTVCCSDFQIIIIFFASSNTSLQGGTNVSVFVYNGIEPLTNEILDAHLKRLIDETVNRSHQMTLLMCRTHCDLALPDTANDRKLVDEYLKVHSKQLIVYVLFFFFYIWFTLF